MARIGAKLEAQVRKETRRYNTIVNRYNRQNPTAPKVSRITNAQLLNSGMKADEIRFHLKLMSLLQSEKDFVRPISSKPNAYEEAQFSYLRKRQKAALTRRFNEIQKDIAARVAKGEIIQTNLEQIKLKAEINNLTRQPRSGPSLIRQLARLKRRQVNKIKYGTWDAPDWAEVTLDHFLAAMNKASLDNTAAGQRAMKILEQFGNKLFQQFLQENPQITLDLVYNTDFAVVERANQLLAALEVFLQSHPEYEVEDDEEDYQNADGEDPFWND